jgi:6-phosphogluconolactonase
MVRAIAFIAFLVGFVALTSHATAQQQEAGVIVYIGTQSSPKSQGIYMTRMDPKTGALSQSELAVEAKNPNFVAFHPSYKFLYACAEVTDAAGAKTGGVASFAIDATTGKLTPLNQQPSGGKGPCFVSVDKAGKNVLVANYGGGSIASLPIRADGSVGDATAFVQHTGSSVNSSRQKEPHAHGIYVSTDNRFAYVPDLGLDKVMIYQFDAEKGTLTPNDPPAGVVPPGSGPRHFAFHPKGGFAYVINEMLSTVTAFKHDAKTGALPSPIIITDATRMPSSEHTRSSAARISEGTSPGSDISCSRSYSISSSALARRRRASASCSASLRSSSDW